MAGSRVDFANANNIFRLQKAGARFTPQTMAAARRIVEGNGNANDAQLIRQQLGIYKTGASQAKQQLRAAQTTVTTAIQAGQSIEMIGRGGTAGAVGIVNLVRLGSNELDKIIRSKTVRSLFENAAQAIGKDVAQGTRAYQSVRGAFRQAVPVVEAAMMGWDIGTAIQENWWAARAKENARQALVFDTAVSNNIDFKRAKKIAANTQRSLNGEIHWMEKGLRTAGFDTGYEDELKQRVGRQAARVVGARQNAEDFGIDVQNVLARAARDKGKTVAELTDFEKADAIDAATQEVTNPDNYAATQYVRDDPRVATEEALANADNFWSHGAARLADAAFGAVFKVNPGLRSYQARKEHEQAVQKVVDERIAAQRKKREDAEHASELIQRSMTPTQRLFNRDADERARAEFNSQRSRHQAWNND